MPQVVLDFVLTVLYYISILFSIVICADGLVLLLLLLLAALCGSLNLSLVWIHISIDMAFAYGSWIFFISAKPTSIFIYFQYNWLIEYMDMHSDEEGSNIDTHTQFGFHIRHTSSELPQFIPSPSLPSLCEFSCHANDSNMYVYMWFEAWYTLPALRHWALNNGYETKWNWKRLKLREIDVICEKRYTATR